MGKGEKQNPPCEATRKQVAGLSPGRRGDRPLDTALGGEETGHWTEPWEESAGQTQEETRAQRSPKLMTNINHKHRNLKVNK